MKFQQIVHNKIYIIIIVFLTFPVSCKQPSQGSKQLIIAENKLKQDSMMGIKMISQINDSIFQKEDFYKYHNKNCIVNAYFYKTQYYIVDGKLDEALKYFLYFINHQNINNTQKGDNHKDSIIIKEQTFLNTLIKTKTANDSSIQYLNKQLYWFKPHNDFHNKKAETYTTEYRILRHKAYYYLIILDTFCIILLQILIKRDYKYANSLKKYNYIEKLLKDQISQLTSQTTKNRAEIARLTRKLYQLQATSNMHLGRGKEIFDAVKAGGNMKNISIKDEQCFVDYYAFCNPQKYHELTSKYVTITLRHTTFLILSEMGYNDKEISNILFIKNSTIRNYKMRINKKLIIA